jgi:hypothetical protein
MNKPRKHAELIKAWADGAEIEMLCSDGTWVANSFPAWNEGVNYRVKPPEFPHKWKKEMDAQAAGKAVQMRLHDETEWTDGFWRFNAPDAEYRIKPETVVAEYRVERADDKTIWFGPGKHNLRLTFEDGKLVAAEIIG